MLEGVYEPNSRWVLARQLMVPTVATQLALIVTTQPPVPFRLQLLRVPPGAEVSWTATADYPVALERVAPLGSLSLHNATLPPGKYVASFVLEGAEDCGAGLQPSPVDGALSGSASVIRWQAVYLPSTDDKVCPIIPDDSQLRYFKAMFESWAAAPAASGAPAPPPAKGGKGAAAAAGAGGPRAQLAAAALDKAEAAAAAAAAPPLTEEGGPAAAAPMPTRTLKDGASLALDPDARLSVVATASGADALVLTREQLEERAAAAAAVHQQEGASGGGTVVVGLLAASLEQGKSSRGAMAARRASEFSEWRSGTTGAPRAAIRARAEAMLRIRQEAEAVEEEARAAAAAAALEVSSAAVALSVS